MSDPMSRPLADRAAADAAHPADPWATLRRHTPARIALGRAGTSLPLAESLRFAAAHALARDAVHVALDEPALAGALQAQGWPLITVDSRAASRDVYLRRPDLGRRLSPASAATLAALNPAPVDLVLVLGDGLSALALQRHALPLLQALHAALGLTMTGPAAAGAEDAIAAMASPAAGEPPQQPTLTVAPLVLARQARVALGDEIGQLLKARLVLVLLGERPGLSSPDSLGAYLTFAPQVGCNDAQRNCVSNIRPEGLPPEQAARRLTWLVTQALRRRLTGVALKDDSDTPLLGQAG